MSLTRLTIDALSHEGRGIARHHGKTCFASGALPGEVVEARLASHHARFDEYETVQVLSASADRVEPPCALYGRCGGCDLQHLDAGAQLAHKQQALLDLLARQAGLHADCIEPSIHAAVLGYRRRARLAVWVPRREGRPVLGFRERNGRRVIAVDHCPVLEPLLAPLPGLLAAVLGRLQQPRTLGHVELSLSEGSDGHDRAVILLRTVAAVPETDRAQWQALAQQQQAYLFVQDASDGIECLHAPLPEVPGYCLPAFQLRLCYAGGDFLQANRAVNRALVSTAVDWLAPQPGERILDAFAGLGNFSLPLARRGAAVLGLEVSTAMVDQAERNALGNGLATAQFAVKDLQAAGATLPAPAAGGRWDALVLDPPRTGAQALVSAIVKAKIPRLLYVSCNPATLARDARLFAAGGYRLDRLALVDMFPQPAHSEALALFRRG